MSQIYYKYRTPYISQCPRCLNQNFNQAGFITLCLKCNINHDYLRPYNSEAERYGFLED